MIKNQEFAIKKRSVNQKETLKALANLEDTYLVQNGKKLTANLITDQLNDTSQMEDNSPSKSQRSPVHLPSIKK